MQGRNILVLLNDPNPDKPAVPVYDLSGERLVIALLVRNNGIPLDFFCHMEPYRTESVIGLLRSREIHFKGAKDEPGSTDIERANLDDDRAFFTAHNLAVVYRGNKLTEAQLDGLARFNIPINCVNKGLLSIGNPNISEGAAPSIDELLAGSPTVDQYFYLADDDNKEHMVSIRHTFRTPTGKDSLDYQRSQKFRSMEGNTQRLITNHDGLRKLYDAMIESVSGFVFKDAASCEASFKPEWVDKIPYPFKMNAVQQLFRDADRKNA